MTRQKAPELLSLVESFFRNHLERLRGASPHTIRAYRDALRLLFGFLADEKGCAVADLRLDDLHVEAITSFLVHLEVKRANTAASRNCRLAAIHSFFKHLVRQDLSRADQYQRVLALPSKKTHSSMAHYLEPEEVRLILKLPDRRTTAGLRDHALLLFLYNTGARVSEALAVRLCDLRLVGMRQVRLHGKGGKERLCPLWKDTANALQRLPAARAGQPNDRLFCNRYGQGLSRDGVAYILSKYVDQASHQTPALRHRRITPHVLRHSCAVALLQAGNDVTVIRDYLGHASISTTSRYITTNLKMKRDALEVFWRHAGITPVHPAPWKPKPDLLVFLDSL